jgi:hypothetical protein
MSNLKHGFYSTNTSINPDSIMIGAAALRSKSLQKLVSLFDCDKLNVGHLYTSAQSEGKDLKWYIWDLVGEVEIDFDYESPQSKYANLVGLLALRIIEFNIDTSKRIKDMVLINPKPYSVSKVDYECDSIVTKINKLRIKF